MRPEIGLDLALNLHDYAAVNRVLPILRRLQIFHIRLPIYVVDQHRPNADTFYHRLFHTLRHYQVLPVITPPALPPSPADLSDCCADDGASGDRAAQADLRNSLSQFVERFLDRHGHYFDEVQIGHVLDATRFHLPRNRTFRPDGPLLLTASLLHRAAATAERYGKRTVLAGMRPLCPALLEVLGQLGALEHFDVVAGELPGGRAPWIDGEGFRSFLEIQRRVAQATRKPLWITHTAPTPVTQPLPPQEQQGRRSRGLAPPPASDEDFLHDMAYAPFERLYLDARTVTPEAPNAIAPPTLDYLQRLIAHKRLIDRQPAIPA